MKRIAVIAGIVVSIAIAFGAFAIAGNDGSSEAKSSETSQKATTTSSSTTTTEKKQEKSTKDFTLVVVGATKSASGAPVPSSTEKDDDESDDKKDDDKYEARKQFVGVSPSEVKAGRTVEVQVRGFAPGSKVTVVATPKNGGTAVTLATIDLNSKGRGKVKVPAPAIGQYVVTVEGSAKPSTKLTVKQK